MGAYWDNNAYAVSCHISATAVWRISHLEMLNIMLVLKVFAHALKGKHITFHIDNQAVVYSLKFNRIKDKVLQSIVKTIWLLAVSYDVQVSYSHIPGILNKEVCFVNTSIGR